MVLGYHTMERAGWQERWVRRGWRWTSGGRWGAKSWGAWQSKEQAGVAEGAPPPAEFYSECQQNNLWE